MCAHVFLCICAWGSWDHRCAFLATFQGILWGCSAGSCHSHLQSIHVPFLRSCSGQLPHLPSARRHKEKGETGNNQRPRMSISTSVTQAQSRKDSCHCPRSLRKALGGACWMSPVSAHQLPHVARRHSRPQSTWTEEQKAHQLPHVARRHSRPQSTWTKEQKATHQWPDS